MSDVRPSKQIYWGHGHVVKCDGVFHVATTATNKTRVQCRCFCADPEYLAHGYTFELGDRYGRAYEAEQVEALT